LLEPYRPIAACGGWRRAPSLQYLGVEAKGNAWAGAFATYQQPPGYEIRGLTIVLTDDVAFSHSLNQGSGTLESCQRSDFRLRWTVCFRKIDGNGLIAPEKGSRHASSRAAHDGASPH
jgi:ketosteroid isomerase-like protein